MVVRPIKLDLRRVAVCAALVLLLLTAALGAAGRADAAPQDPILSLGELQTMLAASPTGVAASFKTVVKGGADAADIQNISCTLLGIVPDAATDGGDLIFFKSDDAVIDDAGGIVDGMSGSPVYVNVGGVDELVGAVSYGDVFTKGGYGLATPIEHMMTLETDFTPVVTGAPALRSVQTANGSASRVLVEPTGAAALKARPAAGTIVMRPLSLYALGGIPEQSSVYRMLSDSLSKRGITLTHAVAGGTGAAPGFVGPILPGASVGALFARGDLWYGGIGTITYLTDDDKVVAFGHPLGSVSGSPDEGATSLYMTYANVLGIWGSTLEPYKMVVPGDVSGEIVRDSGPGIVGAIGAAAAEATFTSNATYAPSHVIKQSVVDAAQAIVDQPLNSDLTASLLYPAMWWATGAYTFPGSIAYHLQIKVSDGANEYTVDRTNQWDSQYDAASLALIETQGFFNELLANQDGVAPCKVESVTMDATFSPQHNSARILDVHVDGGLHVGTNDVVVTLQRYGVATPLQQHVSLVIPAGVDPTKGLLYASAPDLGVVDDPYGGYSYYYDDSSSGVPTPPQSLEQIVDSINDLPQATVLQVAFDPVTNGDPSLDYYGQPWGPKAIVTSQDIGMVTQGSMVKRTSQLDLVASPSITFLHGTAVLMGELTGISQDTTVDVYRQDSATGVRTLVAHVPVELDPNSDSDSSGEFFLPLTNLTANARYTVSWNGDDNALATSAAVGIRVRAGVGLAAAALPRGYFRLTASVSPRQTSGYVRFQSLRHGVWFTLKSVPLTSSGSAQMLWRPSAGSYSLRAVFSGSTKNASAGSSVRRLRVH